MNWERGNLTLMKAANICSASGMKWTDINYNILDIDMICLIFQLS